MKKIVLSLLLIQTILNAEIIDGGASNIFRPRSLIGSPIIFGTDSSQTTSVKNHILTEVSNIIIRSGSKLIVDDGVTFEYAISSSSVKGIIFEDSTSEFVLNNATFKINSSNGAYFVNGNLVIDGNSFLTNTSTSTSRGLFLGAGLAGDCRLRLDGASSLSINNTSIISRNRLADSFDFANGFGQINLVGSGQFLFEEPINFNGSLINFDFNTLIGKQVRGVLTGLDTVNTLSKDAGDINIRTLDWSPSGNYLAVGTGKEPANQFSAELTVFQFTGNDLVVTTSKDTGVLSEIYSVRWSPNGQYLAVGAVVNPTNQFGAELTVFRFTGNDLVITVSKDVGNTSSITSIDWSPDGEYLAVGATADPMNQFGAELTIFRFTGNDLVVTTSKDTGDRNVRTLAWSPNGQYLAVGTGSNPTNQFGAELTVFRFTESDLVVTASKDSGNTSINTVSWSPDGKYLAVGAATDPTGDFGGNELTVWEFTGNNLLLRAAKDVGSTLDFSEVESVAWSSNGKYLAVGAYEPTELNYTELTIWEFLANALILKVSVNMSDYSSALFQNFWIHDSKYLATGKYATSTEAELVVFPVQYALDAAKDKITNFKIDLDVFASGNELLINNLR